jgi:hypothetical protein
VTRHGTRFWTSPAAYYAKRGPAPRSIEEDEDIR